MREKGIDLSGVVPRLLTEFCFGDFYTRSGLDLALHLLHRSYGPRVALAVEDMFAYERRGTVWTNTGRVPVAG